MFGSLRSPATASPGRPGGPRPPPAPATDRTSDPSSIARAASMPHRAPTRSGGPATRRSSGPSACGVGSWSTSTGSALPSRTRNACDLSATCASRCGGGERRGTVRSSFGIAAVAWSRCANRTSSSAAGTGTGCRGSCPRGRSDPLSWRHTPWICCGSSIRPRRAPSPFWQPAARRGRASPYRPPSARPR